MCWDSGAISKSGHGPLDESILRNIETKLPNSSIADSGWIRVQKSDLHASVMAALLSVEAVLARALLSYGWVGRFFDTNYAETRFFRASQCRPVAWPNGIEGN
jgi:hypothetical protein